MDRIFQGRDIQTDFTGKRRLKPDFCIVGSGAGGGVCALKLAEAGFDVVVLEEGPHVPKEPGHGGPCHVRRTLRERESLMYRQLYQEGAGRLTKDGSILVLQGRCLGGGTAVNWSACLPPPELTLRTWKAHYGTPFTSSTLRPYIQEVVNYLNIHRDERYNTSARKLIEGCKALNYHHGNLPNNTVKCRECGSCGTGCPYDRKQSGFVKWIPDAAGLSASPAHPVAVFTDTEVWRLIARNRKVLQVNARFLGANQRKTGFEIEVEPKLGVILAAGAIGTPAVLLRSDIKGHRNQVGKRTHIHPITICFGRYDHPTHSAYGVPDNMMTEEFGEGPTGYLIETGSSFPVMTSVFSLDFGANLRKFMRDYYPNGTVLYAHHNSGFDNTHPYGTVRLDNDFRPQLDYKLHPANEDRMRESLKEMTKIHLSAGAESVYHVTNPALEIESPDDLDRLDNVEFRLAKTSVLTVHVMGGCLMGSEDEERAVVDENFKLRGFENLWVADGSLFPTGLGANPQVTIYSLALRASELICQEKGRPFKLKHQQPNWPWNQ